MKKALIVTAATVIVVAFALPAYVIARSSPPAQEAVTGDWAAERQETSRGTALSIFLNNNNNITGWDHLQMSVVIPLRDFTGLNPSASANAQFSLRREAGAIALTGVFKNNRGIGEFRFEPNGGFVRTMWDLGYEGLTTEKLFVMTVHNIGAGYINELKALGYDKVPLNILIAMRVHGVDGQFIRAVEKMGFAKLSASKLIALRINGLSNERTQSALALGDDDIPLSKLLEMRHYGVDAEFIKEMGEAGYSNLKPDTLILLKRFGVDAHFVKEMRDAGYTDLSIRDLIKLRVKGMKRGRGRNVVLINSHLAGATSIGMAIDISGTWSFSVDLESGQHSAPTFIFKQQGGKLTGIYKGQLGEHKVTGSIKRNKVEFWLEVTDPNSNQTIKISYSGTIESPTRMTGAIKATSGQQGKWTATKK